jgi:hypothetical protein
MDLKANILCGGVNPIIELSEIGSILHEKNFSSSWTYWSYFNLILYLNQAFIKGSLINWLNEFKISLNISSRALVVEIVLS